MRGAITWNSLLKVRVEPGKSLAIVGDPAVYSRGQYQLRYRVRTSGAIVAQLQFKRDGKWSTETVSSVPRTEAEANIAVQARLQAWRESRAATGLPGAGDPLEPIRDRARAMLPTLLAGPDPKGKDTLGEAVEVFLRHVKVGRRAQPERERHLQEDWAPLHGTPLAKITKRDIADRVLAIKEARGKGKPDRGLVAANRSRSSLSALFKWAVGQGWVETNMVTGSNKAGEELGRTRELSREELREIWAATEGNGDQSDYNRIVRLLALTGQRREEVGGMRWSEMDLQAATWTLPAARCKNRKAMLRRKQLYHQVPLSRQAVAILEAQRAATASQERPLVFGEGDGPYSGWSRSKTRLDGRIARLRAERRLGRSLARGETPAGKRPTQAEPAANGDWMEHFTLHDARRAFSTIMNEEGLAWPHVVDALLNHVKTGVEARYNLALYRKQAAEAMTAWANHLLNAPAEAPTELATEPAKVIRIHA